MDAPSPTAPPVAAEPLLRALAADDPSSWAAAPPSPETLDALGALLREHPHEKDLLARLASWGRPYRRGVAEALVLAPMPKGVRLARPVGPPHVVGDRPSRARDVSDDGGRSWRSGRTGASAHGTSPRGPSPARSRARCGSHSRRSSLPGAASPSPRRSRGLRACGIPSRGGPPRGCRASRTRSGCAFTLDGRGAPPLEGARLGGGCDAERGRAVLVRPSATRPHPSSGVRRRGLRMVIKHEGDKWVLYTKDESKVLGRHDTKEEAEKQEKAIHAGGG